MHAAFKYMKPYAQPPLSYGIVDGEDGEFAVVIFDVTDPDGRRYRIEVQSSLEGDKALAIVRKNPWSRVWQGPNAGVEYATGHCRDDGYLCLGTRHRNYVLKESPYDVDFALRRAVYWCTAFSEFKKTGHFPQPGQKRG